MKILPWYKKYLGYLLPIVIAQYESDYHQKLKIKYYQGQWQLESADALYSDGHRYAPFRLAFDFLAKNNELLSTKHFLLLGAGLGSALLRLHKVYQVYPQATLVEYDKEIIRLSKQYYPFSENSKIECVHSEAQNFLDKNNAQYDLIGIDIFEGLTNSHLILQTDFWQAIKKTISVEGNIILNSIFIKKNERLMFEKMIEIHFTFYRINRTPNYIYILKLK